MVLVLALTSKLLEKSVTGPECLNEMEYSSGSVRMALPLMESLDVSSSDSVVYLLLLIFMLHLFLKLSIGPSWSHSKLKFFMTA